MPSLSYYFDTTDRLFVKSFIDPTPVSQQTANISDSINLSIYFLAQTGVSSAPYTYLNLSASTVKAILGIIAGIPSYGSFCLTDGTTTSGAIPFNDNPTDVQTQMANVLSWNNPTVVGGIGGPWIITAGVNGTLAPLTATLNQLAPSSVVLVTNQSSGSSTSPAVNLVRLALNPIAEQTTWTNLGTPTYGFTGGLSLNPVAIQELMGGFLSMSFAFSVQETINGTLTASITLQNTLLPSGASYTPPVSPSAGYQPSFTTLAGLQAITTAATLPLGFMACGLLSNIPCQFQLQANNTGVLPSDYNVSTNFVSWHQLL